MWRWYPPPAAIGITNVDTGDEEWKVVSVPEVMKVMKVSEVVEVVDVVVWKHRGMTPAGRAVRHAKAAWAVQAVHGTGAVHGSETVHATTEAAHRPGGQSRWRG